MGRGRRTKARFNRFAGVKLYKETKPGQQIIVPVDAAGNQANLAIKLSANLLDITDTIPTGATVSTLRSYQSLYERYAILGVKFRFIPTNTSSDSTTRRADRVTYAVNRSTVGIVGSEDDIIRQDDCKFTNTNREFSIYVKYPKPVMLQEVGQANLIQNNFVGPTGGAGTSANLNVPTKRGLTWLSTRMRIQPAGPSDPTLVSAQPDHLGADVHITTLNNSGTGEDEPYTVYTMFKTIYFAFTNQN